MIPKRIEEIDAAVLQALVGATQESVTLDFKRDLPGDTRDASKEFLADVCALANTRGGDLVYGVDEDDEGVAGALVGHQFNPDGVITRLANVLADGLEPRLQGVRMEAIDLGDEGRALIVRVPRAFAGIHRSLRDGHFWIRDSRSKRQLDVAGVLNRMREVLGREDLVASFFAERYGAVLGGTYPLTLDAGPKLVIHILPARDFLAGEEVDLSTVNRPGHMPVVPNGTAVDVVPTRDGLLHLSAYRNGAVRAATLAFRSGVLEAVGALAERGGEGGDAYFALEDVEDGIFQFLQRALPLATQFLTDGWPVTVRAAVVGAQGLRGLPRERWLRIDLDVDQRPRVRVHTSALVLPDLYLEAPMAANPLPLRPMFDRLWQSWGLPRSFSFAGRGAQGEQQIQWRGHPIQG